MAEKSNTSDAAVQGLSDWLMDQILRSADIDHWFSEFCNRLLEIGLPVERLHLSTSTLHPMFVAASYRWQAGGEAESEMIENADMGTDFWLLSPVKYMSDNTLYHLEYRLNEPGEWSRFPLISNLAEQGFTHYVAEMVPFTPGEKAIKEQDGMYISWASRQADGFSERDIAVIKRLDARLAVATKMAAREQTAKNVLSAYLGADAGKRVLDGQIKLGDGDLIHAVIWYSDLRRSTDMADSMAPTEFIAALNAYFACTAGAVLDHGGEVLRFIGDAVLAIFPVAGVGGEARAARMAVAAAKDACKRLTDVNASRGQDGTEPLAMGIGLHVGEILFGNIGVPERLEFSVIGAAANEVARIEGLCGSLSEPVLVSKALSKILPLAWRKRGPQQVKGVRQPIEVLAPPR